MKTKSLFLVPMLLLMLTGCYKDDNSDCPEGRYIYFNSVMNKYDYEDVAECVHLYLYDNQGKLADTYNFDAQQLKANGYKVQLPFYPPGSYTLVAQVNYSEDYYGITGDNDLSSFRSSIQCGPTELQNDIWQGHETIRFDRYSIAQQECDTVDVYKNTNNFEVYVRFKDGSIPQRKNITAYMEGSNGTVGYNNSCIAGSSRTYEPHTSLENNHQYSFRTMNLNTDSDLALHLTAADRTRAVQVLSLNIVPYLAKIEDGWGNYLYKTQAQLDQEDRFEIIVTLDDPGNTGNLQIIGLVINGWALIKQGEGL